MKKKYFVQIIITIGLLTVTSAFGASNNFFAKGKNLFDKNELEKSKIFFERDIVFNPKSEKSYLYLAKIFDESENDYEMESNLNKVRQSLSRDLTPRTDTV